MTDTNATPNPTPEPGAAGAPPRDGRRGCGGGPRGRRFAGPLVVAAAVAGLVGFGVGKASSAHYWGRHHGAHFGMQRSLDADTLIRNADAGIGRVLDRVDATADQKAKILDITNAAIKDLMPLREAHNAARDKLVAAIKADRIDRAAIEQLRIEHLGLAETLSKRTAQALAETAEVLTPAQRVNLIERWQAGPWWRR